MAELLVCVRDREGHNPHLIGEGHVIVVCADGWEWSHLEKSRPDWRIVAVPGIAMLEAKALTTPQKAHSDFFDPACRHFWLDPSKLSPEFQAWWADDSRTIYAFALTPEEVSLAKTLEPLYDKPNTAAVPPIVG